MTELSPDTVCRLLQRYLGQAVTDLSIERAAGGNGQETWFLDAEVDGRLLPLVLRRDPPGGSMEFTDRRAEHEVLRSLEGSGLPVPRSLACEEAPSDLDRAYLVMERLPGAPPRHLSPAHRATVGRELGHRLAELHQGGRAAPQAPGPSTASELTRAHVSEWRARYDDRRLSELPLLAALFGWLQANVPTTDRRPVLLWGDPGPHNVLVEGGHITGMLDWELAHHGDPLDDLGAAVWACSTNLDADDVVLGYEEATGDAVPRDELDYFVVLACVTRSVISGGGAAAFIEGRTDKLNLVGLALALTVANLARGAVHAGWGSVRPRASDPAVGRRPAPRLGLRPDGSEVARGAARVLRERLASAVGERAVARELRIAAALVETAAAMQEAPPPGTEAELEALRDEVRAALGAPDLSVSDAAAIVEATEALAPLRARWREVLLRDLGERRATLVPLNRLYGDLVAVPRSRLAGEHHA